MEAAPVTGRRNHDGERKEEEECCTFLGKKKKRVSVPEKEERESVCFVGKGCILFFIKKVLMPKLLIPTLVFTFATCHTTIK